MSLEEQRQRQEDETRRIQQESLEHIQTEGQLHYHMINKIYASLESHD